jgi:two-component system response regulator
MTIKERAGRPDAIDPERLQRRIMSPSERAGRPITILMADDDPDDRMMTREAFQESHLANDLRLVEDGVDLMDYLKRRGRFAKPEDSPRPGLILLDLNMPRKDGREALEEIKADPDLRAIRVVVLTTSKAEEDILRTYDLGVSSFITKPVTFQGLVDVVRALNSYWIEIVELPA